MNLPPIDKLTHKEPENPRIAVVVTTINPLTDQLRLVIDGCKRVGWDVFIVGDKKTPESFYATAPDIKFISVNAMPVCEFEEAAPKNHYSRKNIGYLRALLGGYDVIIETDDDNTPWDAWFRKPLFKKVANAYGVRSDELQWINIFHEFGAEDVWPRGFPLEHVQHPFNLSSGQAYSEAYHYSPIQHCLEAGDPDVDAVFRLLHSGRFIEFNARIGLSLRTGLWCPWNSQNTTWWNHVPLVPIALYLPSYCEHRLCDIWRAYVANKLLYTYGYGMYFGRPTVTQVRNPHNFLADFKDEVRGYLNYDKVARALHELQLSPSDSALVNSKKCYGALINLGLVDEHELELLSLWADALEKGGVL